MIKLEKVSEGREEIVPAYERSVIIPVICCCVRFARFCVVGSLKNNRPADVPESEVIVPDERS